MFRRLFKKRQKPSLRPLFLFLGLALTLVLAALLLQGLSSPRRSFLENAGAADYRSALQPKWLTNDQAVVRLPDLPQPSYVVGYSDGASSQAALVAWSQTDSRYEITGNLRFADMLSVAENYRDVPRLSDQAFDGAGQAIQATLKASGQPDLILFISRDGNGLKIDSLVDGGGQVVAAAFLQGSVSGGVDAFEVRDADNDGAPEAIWTERQLSGTGTLGSSWSTSVSAYQWAGGRFEFDKQLSWALTTDASLFPEPAKNTP